MFSAVFYNKEDQKLHIYTDACTVKSFATTKRQRYHVTISQNSDGYMTVFVNGEQIVYEKNETPKNYKKVEIWASGTYGGVEKLGEIDILVISDTIPPSGKVFD